jgi:very-short-patch-repair endonuclease
MSSVSSGVVKLQRLSKGKHRQARELRKNMTPAEVVLWEHLRRKNVLNIKFRRQQIIEGFIVDFFCEPAKLVLEVDGEIHNTPGQKSIDAHRKEVFSARGLQELRFTNKEVLTDIELVLERIRRVIQKR